MSTDGLCFVFDLDGLLLDTETTCLEVAEQVLQRHGATLTTEARIAALGKRPIESWTDVAQVLNLDVAPEQLFAESEEILLQRWPGAKLLPGALRLLLHLHQHGIPMAVATSTSRKSFNLKLKADVQRLLAASVCGDEVVHGKPAPDVYLEAARRLGVSPSACIAVEDAPSGVQAAMAAGMRVVVVPSLVDRSAYPQADPSAKAGVVAVLPSLLAVDAPSLGLPPFADVLAGGLVALEDPLLIRGTVVKGFGRGSKELGIPTANVDSSALSRVLSEAVTGIYAGWAALEDSPLAYPMVMSIGWNPFFGNKHKTAEPWLLHEFDEPFYDVEIRLVVAAYVRPEADFVSLEALVQRIHEDARVSRLALSQQPLAALAQHAFLHPLSQQPTPSPPPPAAPVTNGAAAAAAAATTAKEADGGVDS